MEGDKTADNEKELTSTSSSAMGKLLSTNKEEKNDLNDTLPTSSTDASTSVKSTHLVSDDPISSTSSEMDTAKSKTIEKSSDVLDKATTFESEVELLDMSQPTEKIEENVDDLVSDLETLLGESTESFSLPFKPEDNEKTEVTSAVEEVSTLLADKPDNEVSSNTGLSPDDNINTGEPVLPESLENESVQQECVQNEVSSEVVEAAKYNDGSGDFEFEERSTVQDSIEKVKEQLVPGDANKSIDNNSQDLKEASDDPSVEVCEEESLIDAGPKIEKAAKDVDDGKVESNEDSTVNSTIEKSQEIVSNEDVAPAVQELGDNVSQNVTDSSKHLSKPICEGEKIEESEDSSLVEPTEHMVSELGKEVSNEAIQNKEDTVAENADNTEKSRETCEEISNVVNDHEESSITPVQDSTDSENVEKISPCPEKPFEDDQVNVEREHNEETHQPSEGISVETVQSDITEDQCKGNPEEMDRSSDPQECEEGIDQIEIVDDPQKKQINEEQEVQGVDRETVISDIVNQSPELVQDDGTEEPNESNKCASKEESSKTLEEKTEILDASEDKDFLKGQEGSQIQETGGDEEMELQENETDISREKQRSISDLENLKDLENPLSKDITDKSEDTEKQDVEVNENVVALEQESNPQEATETSSEENKMEIDNTEELVKIQSEKCLKVPDKLVKQSFESEQMVEPTLVDSDEILKKEEVEKGSTSTEKLSDSKEDIQEIKQNLDISYEDEQVETTKGSSESHRECADEGNCDSVQSASELESVQESIKGNVKESAQEVASKDADFPEFFKESRPNQTNKQCQDTQNAEGIEISELPDNATLIDEAEELDPVIEEPEASAQSSSNTPAPIDEAEVIELDPVIEEAEESAQSSSNTPAPIDEAKIIELDAVIEEPEESAQSSSDAVHEQPQDVIMEVGEIDNKLPVIVEDTEDNREHQTGTTEGEEKNLDVVQTKEGEAVVGSSDNIAEELENSVQSINPSVNEALQENIITLNEGGKPEDQFENKDQQEVVTNVSVDLEATKEDGIVTSSEEQLQSDDIVKGIEDGVAQAKEDTPIGDQLESEVKEDFKTNAKVVSQEIETKIVSKEMDDKILVSEIDREGEDVEIKDDTEGTSQEKSENEETEDGMEDISGPQEIDDNEVLQANKVTETTESFKEHKNIGQNKELLVETVVVENEMHTDKEDEELPSHEEKEDDCTEKGCKEVINIEFSEPKEIALSIALQIGKTKERVESMDLEEDSVDDNDKQPLNMENKVESEQGESTIKVPNEKEEVATESKSKEEVIEQPPNKITKNVENIIAVNLSSPEEDTCSISKGIDYEGKRDKKKLDNFAKKVQEIPPVPEINIRRKTVEQDLEKVVCLSEESSDSDTSEEVIKNLPKPADDNKVPDYEQDALIHDVPLVDDLPPNQEESDLIQIAREVEQLQNVETNEPVVSEIPSEESMPGIEDILSDQPRGIPAGLPVDTAENLETILAVASLQNEPLHEVKVERRLSEKELREMEAIRMAVASITDSSQDTYDSYLVESSMTMENSIPEIPSDVQELSSDVQELSNDVQELSNDTQILAATVVNDSTDVSCSSAETMDQEGVMVPGDDLETIASNQTEEGTELTTENVSDSSSKEADKSDLGQTQANICDVKDSLNFSKPDHNRLSNDKDMEETQPSASEDQTEECLDVESEKPTAIEDVIEQDTTLITEHIMKERDDLTEQVKDDEISIPDQVAEKSQAPQTEQNVSKNEISVSEETTEENAVPAPEQSVEVKENIADQPVVTEDEIPGSENVVEEKKDTVPQSVVEEKEVPASKNIVEESEEVTPEPVVAEKQVARQARVVEEEIIPSSKQVVEEKAVRTHESVVDEREISSSEPVIEEKEVTAPRSVVDVKEVSSSKEVVKEKEILKPLQVDEEQKVLTPEQVVEDKQVSGSEQVVEDKQVSGPEQVVEDKQVSAPEQVVEDKQVSAPEQVVEDKKVLIPEQVVEDKKVLASEQVVEGNEVSAPQQVVEERSLRNRTRRGNKVSEPLSITVEEGEKKDKPYSPKVIIKPVKVPDEEVSTTSDAEGNKGSLKITITKQSDKMHSILKVYSPEDDSETPGTQEEPIPKLIIKPKIQQVEQQHSPKMATRSSKVYSPTSTQRCSSPRVTIKPVVKPAESKSETLSPLKITFKPVVKLDEGGKKQSPKTSKEQDQKNHNPKITIKPIPKPPESDKEESPVSTPKVTIKPIKRHIEGNEEENEQERSSPKITIKPVVKPAEAEADHANQVMPKLKIKPIKKHEDEENNVVDKDRDSPKISIKPIVKPTEIEEDEEIKERIVLKINKGNLPTPSKDSRKREYPEDDKTEKMGKLKLKFSTTGGQTHIVQEGDEGCKRQRKDSGYSGKKEAEELSNKRASEEKLPEKNKRLRSSITPDKVYEDSNDEVKVVDRKLDSPIVISEEDSRSQHSADCVIVEDSQSSSLDISKIADIASRTTHIEATPVVTVGVVTPSVSPAPKRRGRPRKVPLEIREELKDPVKTPQTTPQTTPQSTPVAETSTTLTDRSEQSTPASTPSPGGRPKRSCRGQNIIAALGIKPRKPRGRGTARGGKVNMGDREPVVQAPGGPVQTVAMKPEKVKNKNKKKKKKSRRRSKSS